MRQSWTTALVFALLISGASSAAAQGDEEGSGWEHSDPAGDQHPLVDVGVPYPGTPVGAHADVVGISIPYEDELGFFFDIEVAQLNVATSTVICCLESAYFFLNFRLGSSPVEYRANIYMSGSMQRADAGSFFDAQQAYGDLCLYTPESGCYYQPLIATLDDEADKIHVWFPKDALLGKMEPTFFSFEPTPPPGLASSIRAGDLLSDITLTSQYVPAIFGIALAMVDDVPNDGAPLSYKFQRGVANNVIAASFGADPDTTLAVVPGENQTLAFTIQNLASSKRLIALEYSVEAEPEVQRLYRPYGPASVTVPGGQSRTFNLAMNVGSGADITKPAFLAIRGVSAGHPDELAFAVARVVPGAALGPNSTELHVHTWANPFADDPLNMAICAAIFFGTCTQGFLSPLGAHPEADDERPIESQGLSFNGGPTDNLYLGSDTPISAPIMFERDQPLEVDLSLSAGPLGSPAARVRAILFYSNEETSDVLFDEVVTANIGAGPTLVQLVGPARFNPDVRPILPAGSVFNLRVEIVHEAANTGTTTWNSGGTLLHPESSVLRLPLTELPDDLRRNLVDSPLQMSVAGGHEDFVNPGEGRLYNISVLNQGETSVRFQVDSSVDLENWSAHVLPGRVFQVEPGDAVTLGALIRASGDAVEGDTGVARINASVMDTGAPDTKVAPVGVILRTVVTLFELPDDSGAFNASADDLAKVVEVSGGKSPGPGAALGLLAALGLAAAQRARRHRPPR